jgi:hypothetical protein
MGKRKVGLFCVYSVLCAVYCALMLASAVFEAKAGAENQTSPRCVAFFLCLRHAVGAEFLRSVQTSHFDACFASTRAA